MRALLAGGAGDVGSLIRFPLGNWSCDVFGGMSRASSFGIDASELSGRRGLAVGRGVGSASKSSENANS